MFYELVWFIESFLGYLIQLWFWGENTVTVKPYTAVLHNKGHLFPFIKWYKDSFLSGTGERCITPCNQCHTPQLHHSTGDLFQAEHFMDYAGTQSIIQFISSKSFPVTPLKNLPLFKKKKILFSEKLLFIDFGEIKCFSTFQAEISLFFNSSF